ncbi:MAG: SDR family NAD(P)-dependent oxidoreductase [Solirubrobacterales bacterium]|nr:SDR family NAD(P)-dependent oxidoreductase [Solirubrobacterales bacterium]
MTDISFEERVAIVTGAGQGLGRAYALELARRGARVVVNDVRPQQAQAVVAEIVQAGGEAAANSASVSTVDGGRAIVQAALDAFGTVDVVINNAGIVRDRSFAKMSPEEVEAVLDVHLRGAFHVTQPAFAVMRERGYGRVLFVTSGSGLFGNFGQANYAAAKMGVVGLARTLAIEGANYGIRANAIAPLAHTPMTDGLFGGAIEDFRPEEVVPMALFLVAEECGLTGEVFSAGGGRFARVLIGVTRGWVAPDARPTVEEIREHLEEISSGGDLVLPGSLAEEIDLTRSLV